MIDVTIIIITYKSENIIYDFLNKIPSNLKTIIIENSQNNNLKKNIEEKYENTTVHLRENNGISSSLNFAVKFVTTKYFLQISPDIDFNFSDLNLFIDFANKKKDNFAALGPRFLGVNESSHVCLLIKKIL
jgi:N-acetylglucosaminyl-diphospho-decaprenol L-rhamnosyltransferase